MGRRGADRLMEMIKADAERVTTRAVIDAERKVIEAAKALVSWCKEPIHQCNVTEEDFGYSAAVEEVLRRMGPAVEALEKLEGE